MQVQGDREGLIRKEVLALNLKEPKGIIQEELSQFHLGYQV